MSEPNYSAPLLEVKTSAENLSIACCHAMHSNTLFKWDGVHPQLLCFKRGPEMSPGKETYYSSAGCGIPACLVTNGSIAPYCVVGPGGRGSLLCVKVTQDKNLL